MATRAAGVEAYLRHLRPDGALRETVTAGPQYEERREGSDRPGDHQPDHEHGQTHDAEGPARCEDTEVAVLTVP